MDARRFLQVDGPFELIRGTITSPTMASETWGKLNERADNGIIIFTGMSPSAHAASSPADITAGWWEGMIGPGRSIDTDRYFVICVNSLGSCFGTTGPASINPDTGDKYRLTFPVLSLEDIARAAHLVVRHFGIERLHTVVGASMGGMTALAYAFLYPGRFDGLVSLCSATRSLPFSIALRSLQRELIRGDPAWQAGQYAADKPPIEGMRIARKLGMITYRSAEEWAERFGRNPAEREETGELRKTFDIEFAIESYLDAHANKFIGGFDANCYLYLSRAIDLFDIDNHGSTPQDAFKKAGIKRALVIGVRTDFLFPLHQQQELTDLLAASGTDVRFEQLDSIQGHDSFLIDIQRFGPPIAKFL